LGDQVHPLTAEPESLDSRSITGLDSPSNQIPGAHDFQPDDPLQDQGDFSLMCS
jgi:hypothetical protein